MKKIEDIRHPHGEKFAMDIGMARLYGRTNKKPTNKVRYYCKDKVSLLTFYATDWSCIAISYNVLQRIGGEPFIVECSDLNSEFKLKVSIVTMKNGQTQDDCYWEFETIDDSPEIQVAERFVMPGSIELILEHLDIAAGVRKPTSGDFGHKGREGGNRIGFPQQNR